MKKLLIVALICGISLMLFGYSRNKVSAEQRCINNGGSPENRFESGNQSDICYFPDESFCFINDFATGKCDKGDHYYDDKEYYDNALQEYINEESVDEDAYNAG